MDLISFLSVLSVALWLVIIAAVAFAISRAAHGEGIKGNVVLIVIALILVVTLNILSLSMVLIEPTERGVVISALPGQPGIRPAVLQPGLTWIVPFFNRVVTYPTTPQEYTMSNSSGEGQRAGDNSVEARTADGQIVLVVATVIFALNPSEVVNIHITWQDTYTDSLVRPLARGIIRDAVSRFGTDELNSADNESLVEFIRSELAKKLDSEGILLVDFVLHNIAFPSE